MSQNLNEHEQKAIDDIGRYGWHCIQVFSLLDDPIQTTFAYTVGLSHTRGWPELICFGLETSTLHTLLSNAIAELRHKNTTPTLGVVLDDVVEGYPCRLTLFSESLLHQDLGWASWFARREGHDPARISCLQLVWPDRHGRFPNDPDCIPEIRALQTPAGDSSAMAPAPVEALLEKVMNNPAETHEVGPR